MIYLNIVFLKMEVLNEQLFESDTHASDPIELSRKLEQLMLRQVLLFLLLNSPLLFKNNKKTQS